jgi:putative transposase
MPRTARAVEAGEIYHVLNRGNGRMKLFHKPGDYAAFLKVIAQGLDRYPVDLFTYCLMPNHWHLVLRPHHDKALARFMGWIGVTHVRRHHAHYHHLAGGHLYQGRFKSFPVQNDGHFLTLCRYVEANAARAKLAPTAEQWPWSGLVQRQARSSEPKLAAWPVERPRNWSRLVNAGLSDAELKSLRQCLARGRPWGDEAWVLQTADRLGLRFTLRPPGRPKSLFS